jgi:hypothetical protein
MKFGIGGIRKSFVNEACIYENRVLNTSTLLNPLNAELNPIFHLLVLLGNV